MYFINQRYSQANNSTQGLVMRKADGGELSFFSHIVEDDATGEKGDKRIPEGFFELKIHAAETPKTLIFRKSLPWFEFFIEVVGIPGFSLVFIHPGNDQNDTEGCQTFNDQMGNNVLLKEKVGGLSRQACERFYALVYPALKRGERVFYEVRDEYHLWKK